MNTKKFRSISGKLSTLLVATIVVSSLLISLLACFMQYNSAVESSKKLISSVGQSLVNTMEIDAFREIRDKFVNANQAPGTEGFNQICEEIKLSESYQISREDFLKTQENVGLDYIYSMIHFNNNWVYIYDSFEEIGGFDVDTEYDEVPFDALKNKELVISPIYESDIYGTMVTAFVPIIDENGEAIGLVCCDISLNSIISNIAKFFLIIATALIICCIIFVFFARKYINKTLKQPIQALSEAAKKLVKGDMNIDININTNDEIELLSDSLKNVSATIVKLTKSLNFMASEQEKGDMDAVLDSSGFEGAYLQVVLGINNTIESMNDMIKDILMALQKINQGEFNINLKEYPGKKAIVNESVSQVTGNMKEVNRTIFEMIQSATNGRLSDRVSSENFEGGWKEIISGLNGLMDAVSKPINEMSNVLSEVSKGNLKTSMHGNYNGDFAVIKQNINTTISTINASIKDIDFVLNEIAGHNLNLVTNAEYYGDFSTIKNAMDTIINILNNVLLDISNASTMVKTGSEQISNTSNTLAEGATNQAAVIEELSNTIEDINKQTKDTASMAQNANKLAQHSKSNADKCNLEMSKMLVAMNEIREASDSIAKIIGTIDDITFQTDLLALNAAVEAARAGSYGKGFAVVADEVRNLSGRSKEAANETNFLITDAIEKVNLGVETAQNTASSLESILNEINEISSIVDEISKASENQAHALDEVNDGIGIITQVVQNNTATSQESAAAAQELLVQSDALNRMVIEFKLRAAQSDDCHESEENINEEIMEMA